MQSWGVKENHPLGIVGIYTSFNNLSSMLLKVLLVAYAVFFVPIFEEWIFRSRIYECQESKDPQNETWLAKGFRVISNGVAFAVIHFDPLHMIVAGVAGIVFAALREITGSWRTSAICHSLNNTLIMSQYLLA